MLADVTAELGELTHIVEELVELRAAGARGTERVIGVGMDSTELGIDSISVNPSSILRTMQVVSEAEGRIQMQARI